MISHCNNARKLSIDADSSKSLKDKADWYLMASKEYLKAAQSMDDHALKMSLVYLSSSAAYKANLVNQLSGQLSADNSIQQEQINKSLGRTKVIGATGSASDVLHSDRMIFKAYQHRLSGIHKIPKAAETSGSDAVRDLLVLEAKLHELGFTRDEEYHSSLVSRHHDLVLSDAALSTSSAGGDSRMAAAAGGGAGVRRSHPLGQSVRLSSDLGESFMVLKTNNNSVNNITTAAGSKASNAGGLNQQPAANLPPRISVSTGATAVQGEVIAAAYGGGNSSKIKNVLDSQARASSGFDNSPSAYANSSAGAPKVTTTAAASGQSAGASPAVTWTNTVLTWGGFGTGSPGTNSPSLNPPVSKGLPTSSDRDSALNWNEQSLFVPHTKMRREGSAESVGSIGGGRDSSESLSRLAQSAEGALLQPVTDDEMSRSTVRRLDAEGASNADGVANLLKTVRRLGEENAQLLSRVEQLEQQEQRNRRVVREMEAFKQDYADKFRKVRRALRDYSAKYQENSGGGGGGSGGSGPGQEPNPASQGTLDALTAQLQETEAQLWEARAAASRAMARGGDSSLADPPAASASSKDRGGDGDADRAKRMRELEQTVKALVVRIQKANDEIRRRDAILKELDPAGAHTAKLAQKPPPGSDRSRPAPGGIASTSRSSGGSGGRVPPSIDSAGTHNKQSNQQQWGPPSPNSSSGSRRSSASPVYRHPSTATLEALQQKPSSGK